MSLQEIQGRPLQIAVLTVSDTRDKSTDKGGQTILSFLQKGGHVCKAYEIVKDDYMAIRDSVLAWSQEENLDVVITTGGTGIAKRDVTLEAVADLYEKTIPGFGEIFRYLSFTEDIGTKAMASRASAGVIENTLVFSIPGSVGAITLAMEQLILPEIAHLVYEIHK